ncbi:MAG: ABC transporter ATP-binding protein [Cyanobacteria bacterium P01_D01_bin.50]
MVQSEQKVTASSDNNDEKLFTKLKQDLKNYSLVLGRSLVILWTAAPRIVAFLIIVLILESIIPAVTIGINKYIVDTVAEVTSTHEYNLTVVASVVSLWIAVIVLANLCGPWINTTFTNLTEKLTASINLKLIDKADSFVDLTNFENANFYDELAILQAQSSNVPINLLGGLLEIFTSLVTQVTMLVLLASVSWWIPLLILATYLPQTYVSFKLESEVWHENFAKSPQIRRMRYFSSLMLTDSYAKEVRLFGLSSLFRQRYLEAFEDRYQIMEKLRGKQVWATTTLGLLSALGNGFSFVWVVQQALAGKLTPGSIIVLIQSLGYIQQNITRFLQYSKKLQKGLLFMDMFFKFMDTQPTMALSIPGKSVPKPMKSGIVFDNVEFAYPDGRVALSGISLTLNPGETVALVGENGAGKSTLVKLLARFYEPTKGNIFIDGENLKDVNLEEWRQQIGVVFQDFCRYSLSVGENIALGDTSAMDDLERLKCASEKSEIKARIEKLPQAYDTLLGKQFDGTELSGGEWQKVAIARAFVREKDAQLMILDEPTAALDPRSEYEIYRSFAELVKDKIAILVTHRLASVSLADRILVMKAGKLVEMGTHEELLLQNGEYASLWNMQAEQYQFENQNPELKIPNSELVVNQ